MGDVMKKNILELKNISKIFPHPENPVVANNKVNMEIREGEIHAIIGENGAGKSTLMNLLYGNLTPTEGSIFFRGEKVEIDNPGTAISTGIGMVHQHFNLIPSFTVAENLVFGFEPTNKCGLVDLKRAKKITREISEKNKLFIDPEKKVKDCVLSEKQKIEILKILFYGAEVLIFDEPTAVLTPQKTKELFNVFFELKKKGKTIIFITHKLKEVMDVADRITVMRKGEIVNVVGKASTSKEELASMMVGRDIKLIKRKIKNPENFGKDILRINNLSYQDDYNIKRLSNVSLSVKSGEIVGIAGVGGNGQKELIESIAGLNNKKNISGSIEYNNIDITHYNSTKIRNHKIGYITGDRFSKGVCGSSSVYENLIMGIHNDDAYRKGIFINHNKLDELTNSFIEDYEIKLPSKDSIITSLSGGNVQKCIFAREIFNAKELIITEEPTRGVDIGAIEFIHEQLISKSKDGYGVLLVSTDLDEIISLSTKILVIYCGRIVGIVNPEEEGFENKIALMMGGVESVG